MLTISRRCNVRSVAVTLLIALLVAMVILYCRPTVEQRVAACREILRGMDTLSQGITSGNTSHLNRDLCQVRCTKGVPCKYKDEVDLRIIVLTYNRPESLCKCLKHVFMLDTMGDKVAVDIWIDRDKTGHVDENTVQVARDFQNHWKRGRACVHEQQENAYIIGQWIDTWRPRVDTKEIGLILEDDIDLSTHAYRWLKHVDRHFHDWPDIAGYTLQMENVKFVGGKYETASGPKTDSIFLQYLPNTWGFSPHPKHWRNFQDWFHEVRKDETFLPYMPGTEINNWFINFVKSGRQDSMWEMWDIYYFFTNKLFTVNPNLQVYSGREDVLLDTNRQEAGLHYSGTWLYSHDNSRNLMTEWNPAYVAFPHNVTRYCLDGTPFYGTPKL